MEKYDWQEQGEDILLSEKVLQAWICGRRLIRKSNPETFSIEERSDLWTLDDKENGADNLKASGLRHEGLTIVLTNLRLSLEIEPPYRLEAPELTRASPAAAQWPLGMVRLGMISKLRWCKKENSAYKSRQNFQLKCHDFQVLELRFAEEAPAQRTWQLLDQNKFVAERFLKFKLSQRTEDEESRFQQDLKCIYQNVPEVPPPHESKWRVSAVNDGYWACQTYPTKLLVPFDADDRELLEAAAFRNKNRLFACEYVHTNGAAILRASQPKVGFTGSRSLADEELFRKFAAAGGGMLCILDARPNISALANAARGGGVESGSRYGGTAVQYLDIDNIHVVRSAHHKINDFQDPLASVAWLKSLSSILKGASKLVSSIERGSSCLLHCSDGWDRTPQVICLSAIIMNPSARTLTGFCALVQRSWVYFGHKFGSRYGHNGHSAEEISPVFVQFCDCLYQLMAQNGEAFQFNHELLSAMADAAYTGNYLTFSFNSDLERNSFLEKRGREYGSLEPTEVSFWYFVLVNQVYFLNPDYKEVKGTLEISADVKELRLWREHHYRWSSALL